jgi:hypothetical protein
MTGKKAGHRVGGAGRWAAIGLCLAVLASPGMAEEEAKAPEPLEAEMLGLRKSITNASAKLRRDVVGIQSEVPNVPNTPAGKCCATNLERIGRRVNAAQRILGDFERCYSEQGNQDMLIAVRIAKQDLFMFAKTILAFANAPTKSQAQGALEAVTRTYNLLRDTAISLEPCEGLVSTIDPDEEYSTSESAGPQKQPRED